MEIEKKPFGRNQMNIRILGCFTIFIGVLGFVAAVTYGYSMNFIIALMLFGVLMLFSMYPRRLGILIGSIALVSLYSSIVRDVSIVGPVVLLVTAVIMGAFGKIPSLHQIQK